MQNRRRRGERYERIAALYLRQNGLRILHHNFHNSKKGEIDLIADDAGTLVFVEVKYRRSHAAGYAEEAVTRSKQRTIIEAARFYLCRYGIPDTRPMRFDVIAIQDTETEGQVQIKWIRDAFQIPSHS